jgi:hypothetical protein
MMFINLPSIFILLSRPLCFSRAYVKVLPFIYTLCFTFLVTYKSDHRNRWLRFLASRTTHITLPVLFHSLNVEVVGKGTAYYSIQVSVV